MENETLAFTLLCAYCFYLGWDHNRLSQRVKALEYDSREASQPLKYEQKTLLYDLIHDPDSPLRRPQFWFYVAVLVYGVNRVMSWLG